MFRSTSAGSKLCVITVAVVLGQAWLAAPVVAGNLLVDPSFENNPLGSYGFVLNNFVSQEGVWGPESAAITGAQGGVTPFSGAKMLRMTNDGLSYTQVVQVTNVDAYATFIDAGIATVDLLAWLNAGVPGAECYVRVAYYTGPGVGFSNGMIQQSPIMLDSASGTWEQFSTGGTIPPGTRWLVTEVGYLNSSIGGNAGYVDAAELTITLLTIADREQWQDVDSSSFTLCEDFEAEPNATGWSTFEMPYTSAGGVEIDRLSSGTAQQFIRVSYNGTQAPHIRDFAAGITWDPGYAFTAFGFDYRTSHEQWHIEVDVGGVPTTIATLSSWSKGFVGLVLPSSSITSFTLRGGLNFGGQGGISIDNMCFGLDGPPPCPACPPGGPSKELVYLITGNATGADWSWKLESPRGPGQFCAEDLCVSGVAATDDVDGDGHLGTPADVATRFANSINDYSLANGCFFSLFAVVEPSPLPPDRPKSAKLFIQYETETKPTLFVGPCGDPRCAALFYLPSTGCPFNPLLHSIVTSGSDCNTNGEDDVVDILLGSSQDANQNQVLDECELMALGLSHRPLGQASLSVDMMTGDLILGNIGTSGLDGVTVGLGRVGNAGISVADLDQYDAPSAAITVYGEVNSMPNQPVASLLIDKSTRWIMTPDFSGVGATSIEYRVYMGSQVVATIAAGSNSFVSGPLPHDIDFATELTNGDQQLRIPEAWGEWPCDTCAPCGTFTCPAGEWPAYCIDRGGCCCVSNALIVVYWPGFEPVAVFDGNDWVEEQGTAVVISASAQLDPGMPLGLTDLELRLSDAATVAVTGERLGFARSFLSATGNAWLAAGPGNTVVSNIGSTGLDGAAIEFTSAASVQMQLHASGPVANAAFSSVWRGTVAGNPDSVAGVVTLQQEGSALRATPDFSGLGATGYGASVYSGDDLVFSVDDPQSIIIHEEWSLWDFIWFNGLWDLLWPAVTSIEVDDGNQLWQVAGDRVQFVPLDPVATPESIERVLLQAANIEEFVISEASSIPVCDASDAIVDLADFAVFMDCFSAPQVSYSPSCLCADLDADGDIDLADFALVQLLFGS